MAWLRMRLRKWWRHVVAMQLHGDAGHVAARGGGAVMRGHGGDEAAVSVRRVWWGARGGRCPFPPLWPLWGARFFPVKLGGAGASRSGFRVLHLVRRRRFAAPASRVFALGVPMLVGRTTVAVGRAWYAGRERAGALAWAARDGAGCARRWPAYAYQPIVLLRWRRGWSGPPSFLLVVPFPPG